METEEERMKSEKIMGKGEKIEGGKLGEKFIKYSDIRLRLREGEKTER